MQEIPLWEKDIPFYDAAVGQPAPSLMLFPVSRPRGMILVLPGGGYTHLAPHEGAPIAERMNGFGWSAAVLRYRLAPYQAPVPQLDARRAMRLLRFQSAAWGYAPDRILIMGFSAGAHLAACAALQADRWAGDPSSADPVERQSARPDGLISCYGVLTMGPFSHAGSRDSLLGEKAKDPALLAEYSLETRVTEDAPPAFLWHTAEDASVPVENSLGLAASLSARRVPFALHVFPRGRHGLGLAESTPCACRWPELLHEWLSDTFG